MDVIKLSLFLIISFFGLVLGDELCYDIHDGYFYCEYGCCGSTYDEYCCGVYSWIIAVAVIGCIIVVAVIVVIVCIVYKKKSHTGRVIQPSGQQQQVQTIQMVHVPPPGYNQQPQYMNMQPYPNQQPPQYPPPQDAAYPPPPPPNY